MTNNKNCTRYYSSRQEKRVAKELHGKVTPNSGATLWVRGDIILRNWLLECKTAMTEKQTFSVPKKWLKALPEEAFSAGKDHWALVFDYGDGNEYYIIDKKTFKQVVEVFDEQENMDDGK